MNNVAVHSVLSRTLGFSAQAVVVVAFLVAGAACSKKKTGEGEGGTTGPEVENKTMSFDAAGSDSGNIDGLQTIHFEFDSSTLSSDARNKLSGNAKWIKDKSNVVVQIEGHCDSKGSIEYNLALGDRRAKAVKAYLTSLGVDPRALSVISYGEEKPLDSSENESAWGKNRRANFLPISQ